jgi:hypothetical protein
MNTDPAHTDIEPILEATQLWLDEVIVKEQFCPFAKPVRDKNQIHFSIQQQSDVSTLLRQVVSECEYLLRNDKIETSLLIYTEAFSEFNDYLDFLEMANELIENAGFEGILQLASFHPDYLFDGAPANCPSHYTNRSPLPMLHLLREDSITLALNSFAQPENIPQRNIDHARALGKAFFQQYLPKSFK